MDCGSPTIPNASPVGTPISTTYQGTVNYTCVSGYEFSTGVTTATATCMASGMWETVPTCQRMLFCCIMFPITKIFAYSAVNCTLPPLGTNASPGTPSSTVYQRTVTYTCVTGYWISTGVTTAMATCMASRMWEPVPTCTSKLWIITVAYNYVIYSCLLHSC